MPFVRISLMKGKSPAYVRALADGVHRALVATFQVPEADRFQVVNQYEQDHLIYDPGYLGIRRTDDVVFIDIVASRTRDTEAKRALYRAIAENLSRDPGLRPEDVVIVLAGNEREDWSFGNGLASYL